MKAWFVLSFKMANKSSCSSITRNEHFVGWLVHSDLNEDQSDSTDDDINESGRKEYENITSVREWDSCLLDPEEQYHLPRSSPVISRKRCNADLKPEKQSSLLNLCLTPPACDGSKLAISPSNNSNPHKLDEFTHSEKPEKLSLLSNKVLMSLSHKKEDSTRTPCNLGNCDFHKDVLQQSKLCNKYCTDTFPLVSQMTQDSGEPCSVSAAGTLRVPLNNGLESGCKRRAFSDSPPASSHLVSSGQARKHGSFIDVHPTEDIYRNSLDQENAHFVVVDMLLEVLEAVKWAVCLQQFKNAHPCQERYETQNTTKTDSFSSCDSGFEDDSTPKLPSNRHCLSLFQGSQSSSMPCSAEDLAHCLVSEFRKQWFPPDNLNIALQEVRVVKRQHTFMQLAAQYTFPMTAGDRLSLTEEIKQKCRMRGTLTWAPPRFQIIFYVQPTLRRSDVVAAQHFLCAGCGTEVESRYIKKLRYCDYLGKYFCDGCHGGEESVIPGRVLCNWDFARYPVCHFSKHLLESIWQQPLFRLRSVAKKLYSQAKELQRFTDLQEQLISTKKLLSRCRLSAGVLVEFEQIPAHVMQELDLFSMDDLIRVKKGQLCMVAKAIFQSATAHIDTCELCQAKGFICEFCHRKEVLFPFQKDTCTRCQDCRACFHISCFRDEPCPKCARLQKRKNIQEAINS